MKYIGRLMKVGVAKEASRGAGAAPVYTLPFTSFSFDDQVARARAQGALGVLADSEESLVTNNWGSGEFEGEVRDKSIGLLLYSLLGDYSVSGPSDSAYTHSFSIDESNQHQSLSFVVYDPNTTEQYKLVMIDSLTISQDLEGLLTINGSFMSKKGNTYSGSVPVVVAENKFTKRHAFIKAATSIAGLSAASSLALKNFSITIAKNSQLDDVLGTSEPEDILNHQLSVEGEFSLNYEDETWKTLFKTTSSRAMEMKFQNNDVTIGSGTRPSLTIQMPKVDFFNWEPDNSLDDIVTQNISFKGNYDLTNSLNIISTCQLVNDVTSY